MDPQKSFCPNTGCPARGHTARGNIKIHCRKRGRLRCTECGKTFSCRRGTPFFYAKTDANIKIVLVLTLIAYGCPIPAIEAAFGFQRRTVRGWIQKAGSHRQDLREHLVLTGEQVLQHVQADEIFVRAQSGKERAGRFCYLFSALCVSTRLWLGSLMSGNRDERSARSLAELVRTPAMAAGLTHLGLERGAFA